MMDAEVAADGSLERLLRARLTAEWPPVHWEPHVFAAIREQMESQPETAGWHRYVLLPGGRGQRTTLVGCVGGFPKANGDVELGYSTLPEFQRRGFATEAAGALVEWLLQRDGVRSVSAQTYVTLPESVKVMERLGMTELGVGDEPGTVRFWRVRG